MKVTGHAWWNWRKSSEIATTYGSCYFSIFSFVFVFFCSFKSSFFLFARIFKHFPSFVQVFIYFRLVACIFVHLFIRLIFIVKYVYLNLHVFFVHFYLFSLVCERFLLFLHMFLNSFIYLHTSSLLSKAEKLLKLNL